MTNIRANTLESGLASGTVFVGGAGGNTGGAAGDPFVSVFSGTGTVWDYTDVAYRGTRAARITLTASSGGGTCQWRPPNTTTEVYGRFYANFPTFGAGTMFLSTLADYAVANSGFSIRVSSTGLLSVYRRAGTAATIGTMTVPMIAGSNWYRLEFHYTVSGEWYLAFFLAESYVPIDVISGTGQATALTFFDNFTFGLQPSTGSLTATANFDNFVLADRWVGPMPSANSKPIATINAPSWTVEGGTVLHQVLADTDSATRAVSPNLTGTTTTMRVLLGDSDTGNKILDVELSSTDTTADATIELYQGSTLIMTRTVNDVPASPTLYSFALTSGEEATLSGGSNLQLAIGAKV